MKKITLSVFLLFFFPLFLLAHDHNGSGFGAGFTHPVLGLDHLLAMLSVGILSAQIGGKAIWTVPAIFVTLMWIGGNWGRRSLFCRNSNCTFCNHSRWSNFSK